MKIKIILLIFASCYLQKISGQNSSFGITTGYSNINMSVDGRSEESSSGYYIGIFKQFKINEKLKLNPELQFAFYERDNGGKFNDLVLPVLLQYNFWSSLSLIVGPQFDYLLGNGSEEYNAFGFSAAFGLNYDLGSNFFINWRMSYGFTERFKNDEILEEDIVDIRSHTFNLGLGYRFY